MTHLSDRTFDFSRDVTRAILGVDALYRRESGDETGLAVLNMDTEGELEGERFPSYAEVAPASRRSRFVRYLYGRMHSNRTVEMYDVGHA